MQVTRSTVLRYGVAVVSAAFALLLTRLFRVVLEPSVFLLFLLAVMVSAWYGGIKPGLTATLLSAWAITCFLLPPSLRLTLNWADGLRIMAFVAVATLISVISGSRRRSNESLREANQARQALIEAVPLPIIVLDLNANVKSWSPAAERVFGWTEQEARDLPFPFVPPDGGILREDLEAMRHGGVLTGYETRCQRKDGSAINISVSAAPARNRSGEINSIICVVADVTERKRSDDALRESEMRFRSVVQSATDGIVLADGHGNIIQWNEGAQEIFGYTEAEVFKEATNNPNAGEL